MRLRLLVVPLAVAALAGCSDAGDPAAPDTARTATPGGSAVTGVDQRFPDVEGVEIRRADDGTYTLDVTMSSPYDTPQRYADGWRVLAPDGSELGSHELAHDHAAEQPFTRSQTGLALPEGVTEVTVEGRDLEHGYGGATVTVEVPSG